MSIAVTPIMLVACTLGNNSLQKVQDIVYQCAVRFIDGQSSSCMKGIYQADAVFYAALSHSSLNVICDINNVHWFPCLDLDHNHISRKDENLSQTHASEWEFRCAMKDCLTILEIFKEKIRVYSS